MRLGTAARALICPTGFEDDGDAACGGSEPPADPMVLEDATNV
jgi:hypothetical protein